MGLAVSKIAPVPENLPPQMPLPTTLGYTIPNSCQVIQFTRNNEYRPGSVAVTRLLRRLPTLSLTRLVFIQQTSSNDIYRGILTVSGQDIAIVVKQSQVEGDVFGFVSQLRNEAASYCHNLECCQGDVVPLFYGFYDGHIGGPVACILLEDCGDPCDDDLYNLDIPVK
jgi:hypothetical protein